MSQSRQNPWGPAIILACFAALFIFLLLSRSRTSDPAHSSQSVSQTR
jgi:hypothetical protein